MFKKLQTEDLQTDLVILGLPLKIHSLIHSLNGYFLTSFIPWMHISDSVLDLIAGCTVTNEKSCVPAFTELEV